MYTYINIYVYDMYSIAIDGRTGYEIGSVGRGIWVCLEGGKGKNKDCNV